MAKLSSSQVDKSVLEGSENDASMSEAKGNNNPLNEPVIDADAPEGWVEEQTGFPPYWAPAEGAHFRAIPVSIDVGREGDDNSFTRFILRATEPTECFRGRSENPETVVVQPGDFFTCSMYASMNLDRFYGFEVFFKVVEKIKLDARRTMWKFKAFVSPETRKVLDGVRAERARQLLESPEYKQLIARARKSVV